MRVKVSLFDGIFPGPLYDTLSGKVGHQARGILKDCSRASVGAPLCHLLVLVNGDHSDFVICASCVMGFRTGFGILVRFALRMGLPKWFMRPRLWYCPKTWPKWVRISTYRRANRAYTEDLKTRRTTESFCLAYPKLGELRLTDWRPYSFSRPALKTKLCRTSGGQFLVISTILRFLTLTIWFFADQTKPPPCVACLRRYRD